MNNQSSEGSAEAFSKLVQAQEFGLGEVEDKETISPTSVDDYTELNARHESGSLADLEGKDKELDPLTADLDTRLNEGVPHVKLLEKDDVPEVSERSENLALHQGDNEEEVQV